MEVDVQFISVPRAGFQQRLDKYLQRLHVITADTFSVRFVQMEEAVMTYGDDLAVD
jgi:hypothetical protein